MSRGLALFESLKKTNPDFHLYVVAFDDECYSYLNGLQEKELTVISLGEFEDDKLRQVKSGRTAAEYCWTCTPSIILYCIEMFKLPSCTYVDADMIFYDNPQILFDEFVNDSILISEHRYTRRSRSRFNLSRKRIAQRSSVEFVDFVVPRSTC
jgi:hypothetical protein